MSVIEKKNGIFGFRDVDIAAIGTMWLLFCVCVFFLTCEKKANMMCTMIF